MVTPENERPVIRHWVSNGHGGCICPCCESDWASYNDIDTFYFCPNCWAELVMDGEE